MEERDMMDADEDPSDDEDDTLSYFKQLAEDK